jgi:hypothetical protein
MSDARFGRQLEAEVLLDGWGRLTIPGLTLSSWDRAQKELKIKYRSGPPN